VGAGWGGSAVRGEEAWRDGDKGLTCSMKPSRAPPGEASGLGERAQGPWAAAARQCQGEGLHLEARQEAQHRNGAQLRVQLALQRRKTQGRGNGTGSRMVSIQKQASGPQGAEHGTHHWGTEGRQAPARLEGKRTERKPGLLWDTCNEGQGSELQRERRRRREEKTGKGE